MSRSHADARSTSSSRSRLSSRSRNDESHEYARAAEGRPLAAAENPRYCRRSGCDPRAHRRDLPSWKRDRSASREVAIPPRKLPRRPTRAEAAALLAAPSRRWASGRRNAALIAVFWRTGLRCSEALDLHPDDVHLDEHELRVVSGKGGKDRVVYLDPETTELLRGWADVRPESAYFFCTRSGRRLDSGYVRRALRRYGRRAGITSKVSPHRLRRSLASELVEENFSVAEVQKLLGHERLETTARP